MNRALIQHSGYFLDCYPYDHDTLIINLNTGKDVDCVFVYVGDPYYGGSSGEHKWVGEKMEMTKSMEHANTYTWSISVTPKYKRLKYHFQILCGKESVYLLADGIHDSIENIPEQQMIQRFIFPWINPSDVNTVPPWVTDTIWYQIFPDRFCRGNSQQKRFKTSEWSCCNDKDYFMHYGGDIKGIESKLSYIADMGFSGIYLTPIFMANSNHKYDVIDYTKIDPDFGTEEEFIRLVTKAHELGLKIMIDAVFNHVSRDFALWTDVMKNGRQSEYYDWFFVNNYPISTNHDASIRGDYYTFSFFNNMPKLNTNNPQVVEYLINLTKHWVADWKVDGIRFDVGNEIAHSFVKKMHLELKQMNPDIFLLGEIWHNAFPWLLGDEYDSVMNYPFLENINNFWENKALTATDFKYLINHCYSLYYKQVNGVLFNMLDSHDTVRLFERCECDENIFFQQLSVLMTMEGTPSIYYGTEIAMTGKDSKENRKCMPWEKIEKRDNATLITEHLCKLVAIRNQYPQARSNCIQWCSDTATRLIHYCKHKDGLVDLEVYINADEEQYEIILTDKILYSRELVDHKLLPGGIVIQLK